MTGSVRISRRVELYWNLSTFLFGWTIDDAVLAFMVGPLTVEVWW